MSDSGKPTPQAAPSSLPTIPKLPSKRSGSRRRAGDPRPWLWLATFALGGGAGVALYRLVPAVTHYFDYWLARLFG